MSADSTQPQSPDRPERTRRPSIADLFAPSRPAVPRENNNTSTAPIQQYPNVGPIASAAAQAQRRRMSLTTLGLSAANGPTSPFNSFRTRGESFGSAGSGSLEESAVAEDDTYMPRGEPGSTPITRRTSFGARALRDIRRGSMSAVPTLGPGSPKEQNNGTSSPPSSLRNHKHNGSISSREAKGRGEGFNWSDNFRVRAERAASISVQPGAGGLGVGGGGGGSPRMPAHARAKSVNAAEPPIEMPKTPRAVQKPDHFQERILKGDFYMD